MARAARRSTRGSFRSAYQPALDGLRAVCVLMVLCFHAGMGWMPGGYLGVSVFFTLSGFLITGLLLREFDRTGRVRLGPFAARRVARLAPAGALCVVLVLVVRAFGGFAMVPHLERDAVGAVLQASNWVQLGSGASYADLFAGGSVHVTSPFDHFWSLAIEEQFYWVWPVVLWAVLRRRRSHGRGALVPVLAITAVFAIAAPLTARWFGPDATYWATPARLAEILVGAALACWMHARGSIPRLVRVLGWPACSGLVVLAVLLPSGDGFAYAGGLPVVALLSALLVWSLQAPGRLRRALSAGPLPVLGRVSYGLYLFHWPVDVLLRERGWDLRSAGGFAFATAIALVLAIVSYRLVERPVRRLGWHPLRVLGAGIALTVVVAAACAFAIPSTVPLVREDDELLAAARIATDVDPEPLAPAATPPRATTTTLPPTTTTEPPTSAPEVRTGPRPIDAADHAADRGLGDTAEPDPESSTRTTATTTTATTTTATTTTATTTASTDDTAPVGPAAQERPAETSLPATVALPPAPNRPVRVLVVGDSTAIYFGQGLAAWSLDHPGYAQVAIHWCQGCGFLLDGTITSFDGARYVADSQRVVEEEVPALVTELQPDIVVLMTTVDDVASRQWEPGEGSLDPTDPRFAARLTAAYGDLTDRLLGMGVPSVAWVVPPTPTAQWADDPGMRDPARWDAQHEVIRAVVEAAGGRDERVSTVDLAAWFAATGREGDTALRPDGVHLTDASARLVADLFAGPSVVQAALATAGS